MAIIHSRIFQSIIAFIIVMAAVFWLFRDNFTAIYVFQKDSKLTQTLKDEGIASYIEKIDNFSLKEYSNKNLLLHYIEAETYYNFKDAPVLLLNIKVTQYDDKERESNILKSKRAKILETGEIIFNGEVNILSKGGIYHEIDTEILVVDPETKQINSNKDVTYLGEDATIFSQGMQIDNANNIMLLEGEILIQQETGSKINTKDLNINLANGEKHYQTNKKSTYISRDNTINSEKGLDLDMKRNLTKLLGKVEILQKSGTKILTNDLIVDQSGGGEVYKSSKPTNYKSQFADIKSQGMYYDVLTQRIELIGGVEAHYE